MNYEIQIFAKDRTKIIRFSESDQGTNLEKQNAWEDFYYAMGSVIDDSADKFRENNTLIARLNAQTISFDEVVDVMCEDLSTEQTQFLTEEREVSVIL